jgi:hypothetical protein
MLELDLSYSASGLRGNREQSTALAEGYKLMATV